MMKYSAFFVILFLISCSTRMYNYTTVMTYPVNNSDLIYENDTLKIGFQLQPKYILINIRNKSETGLKINWDEVSFSINGKTFRVIHKETGVIKINEVQPPTTIPPHSVLEDILVPAQNVKVSYSIYFDTYLTHLNDIFPKTDYGFKSRKEVIQALKGARITIFLPFYMQGKYVSKYYDLVIENIVSHK